MKTNDGAQMEASSGWVGLSVRRVVGFGYGLPRDWMDREQGEGHEFLHEATQVKNIWVPTGE